MTTPQSSDSAEAGRAKLFLSYSRKDLEFVRRLSTGLVARGQDVWVDLEGIQPSEDWLKAIHAAIEGADALAAGAEIIDFKDPAHGALGALPPDEIGRGIAAVAGRALTSATAGGYAIACR